MNAPPVIRGATVQDAAACAAIYSPYVKSTAITFELDAPTEGEMAARISAASSTHAWLIAEEESTHDVLGYAYAGSFHPREAYRFSCSASVYLAPQAMGRGLGKALYVQLIEALRRKGYYQVFGLIAQPNEASNALHTKLGFEVVGEVKRCGWKLGKWWDVRWYQLGLQQEGGESGEPKEITRLP